LVHPIDIKRARVRSLTLRVIGQLELQSNGAFEMPIWHFKKAACQSLLRERTRPVAGVLFLTSAFER
jgi:hypothetical protein